MDIFKVTFRSQYIEKQSFFCRYLGNAALREYIKDTDNLYLKDAEEELQEAFLLAFTNKDFSHTHRTGNDKITFMIEKIKIY
jgi:hypothetical protein